MTDSDIICFLLFTNFTYAVLLSYVDYLLTSSVIEGAHPREYRPIRAILCHTCMPELTAAVVDEFQLTVLRNTDNPLIVVEQRIKLFLNSIQAILGKALAAAHKDLTSITPLFFQAYLIDALTYPTLLTRSFAELNLKNETAEIDRKQSQHEKSEAEFTRLNSLITILQKENATLSLRPPKQLGAVSDTTKTSLLPCDSPDPLRQTYNPLYTL